VRDASSRGSTGSYVYGGIFGIGMRASDAFRRAQSPMSMSVSLNRCGPLRPLGVVATGRDSSTRVVDVEWEANPEGDTSGSRVYRGGLVDFADAALSHHRGQRDADRRRPS
jgi:hypothetical protein